MENLAPQLINEYETSTFDMKRLRGTMNFNLIVQSSFTQKEDTLIAHSVYQRGINLPSYFDITKEQVEFICNEITS